MMRAESSPSPILTVTATIGIAPKVAVEWEDGSVEEFGTEYIGSGYRDDDPWQCEDLVVVGAE